MKKLSIIVSVLGLTIVVAAAAWAVIADTPHDVAVMRPDADQELEICAMCHTPHAGSGQYPLWNRQTSDAVTFTPYSTKTIDMTYNDVNSNRYATYNCLVCHNGITSTLVNYPGPESTAPYPVDYYSFDQSLFPAGSKKIMTGTKNHPVSFTYDPSADKQENNFPPVEDYGSTGGKGISGTYPLYEYSGTVVNQFECATCHAVHDTVDYPGKSMENGKSNGDQVYFLRADNSGSRMCMDCHRGK